MKINQLILLTTIITLASCNGPHKTDAGPTAGADSTLLPGEMDAHLLQKFKTTSTLPFTADTTFMFHMDKGDSLGTNEMKQLDGHWAVHDPWSEQDYILKEFYRIDSIKASGTYANWCDSLQPGMTKSSNAYAISRLVVNNTTQLLIWGIVTASYEACPVTTMQDVYVSVVIEGRITNTIRLAEYVSSVDPPVAMQRMATGVISKDLTVDVNVYEENDEDMDLPELSVTKEYYRFAIKDGKISKLSERKEAPVKVKRKTLTAS